MSKIHRPRVGRHQAYAPRIASVFPRSPRRRRPVSSRRRVFLPLLLVDAQIRARLVRMTAPRVSAERRAAVLAELGALLGGARERARAVAPGPSDGAGAWRPLRDQPRSGQGRAPRTACAHIDTTKETLVYEIGARRGFNPATAQGVPA